MSIAAVSRAAAWAAWACLCAAGCQGTAAPAGAPAPDPAAVLESAIAATGGRSALQGVQTIHEEFAGTRGGVPFRGAKWLVRPGRLRHEVAVQGRPRTVAWLVGDRCVVRQGRLETTLSGARARPYRELRKNWHPVAGVLNERLEPARLTRHRDAEWHGFTAVDELGRRRTHLFDPGTGLLRWVVAEQDGRRAEIEYYDYRPVAGLQWPHGLRRYLDGRLTLHAQITGLTVNGPIAPERFDPSR